MVDLEKFIELVLKKGYQDSKKKPIDEITTDLKSWMRTYASKQSKDECLQFMLGVVEKALQLSKDSNNDRVKRVATILQCLAYIHILDCIFPTPPQDQEATHILSSSELTPAAEAWAFCLSGDRLGKRHKKIIREMWSELVTSSGSNSITKIQRQLAVVKMFQDCMKAENQKEALKADFSRHGADIIQTLLQLYVDVSAMEGLGIGFTKDTVQTRKDIADILFFFWRHQDRVVVDERKRELFTDFLRAVLETIVLVLNQYCCDTNPNAENQENPLVAARDRHLELFNLLVKEETIVDCLCGPRLLAPFTTAFSVMALNVLQHLPHKEKRGWQSFADLLENLMQNEKFLSEVVIRTDALAVSFYLSGVCRLKADTLKNNDRTLKLIKRAFHRREGIWHEKYTGGRRWSEENWSRYNPDAYKKKLMTSRSTEMPLDQSHSFRAILEKYDPKSSKISLLEQEIKNMQKELLCRPDKAIFVVRDSQRCDVLRCVVSGPVGTPYSRGLFVFDVYCPDGYPRVPPLVRFLTTGYGTADFHACLHSSGEVFLNLLGTGSEDDGSGPWKPGESTLCDVLTSIQTLILSDKPLSSYHHSGSQGDEERIKHHESYLPVLTVRYAMQEHLLNPPIGLQGLIVQYFSVQREAVLSQCAEWLQTQSRYNYELTWDCEVLREKLMRLNSE